MEEMRNAQREAEEYADNSGPAINRVSKHAKHVHL